MDKQRVHKVAQSMMTNKIQELSSELEEIRSSLNSATKSSVGDKHETARAMIQLEQERLSKQLAQQRQLLDMINALDTEKKSDSIQSGSLIELKTGWFYLSAGIGKIQVDGTPVFCLSPATPLGQQLLGKKAGDKINLNQELKILSVN